MTLWLVCCSSVQANLRKSVEANLSLLEKDKIMIQHRSTEYQRKADQEAEKRRNLENEGKDAGLLLMYYSNQASPTWGHNKMGSLADLPIDL